MGFGHSSVTVRSRNGATNQSPPGIKTWTDRLGHTSLRSFTDEHDHFWLEQNPARNSKWAKLARIFTVV